MATRFVVETNIHYPTESSLIGDGLRKVVTLAARLGGGTWVAGLAAARALAEARSRSWCGRLAERRVPRARRGTRLQAGLPGTVGAGGRACCSVPGR